MYHRILAELLGLNNLVFAQNTGNVPGSGTAPPVGGGNQIPPGGSGGNGSGINITIADPLGCSTGQGPAILCVLRKVIAALELVAIPVVTLMVLIGGFQILTAGGNAEKITKGRKTIMYAAIGYVVILLAGGVTSIIQSLFR